MTYDEWLNAVDQEVLKLTDQEIGVESLSDWPSMDCYNDELTPYDGAIEALGNDEVGEGFLVEMGLL